MPLNQSTNPTGRQKQGIPYLVCLLILLCGLWALSSAAAAEQKKEVLFSAFDALTLPGKPVELRAVLETPTWHRDVKGVRVHFYVGDKEVGDSLTDEEGFASITHKPESCANFKLTLRLGKDAAYTP